MEKFADIQDSRRADTGRGRRVLYILQGLSVPFDRRAWLQATALGRHGYQVSVICPKARGFNRSREQIEGVDIYRYWLPVEGEGKLGFIFEFLWCFVVVSMLSLRVAVFGRGFDILHMCNPPEIYWPMAGLWRLFGKVFIFDHRDLSPELASAKFGKDDGFLIRTLLLLEKLTFRVAQIVVATNESYRKIAIERGGMRPEEVFIVRSGPSVARFNLYPPDGAFRHGKDHLLVYLGEIGRQDGLEYLIRAVKSLRDDLGRCDFHCLLVGGGPHHANIVAYAEAEGVSDLCTFTGIVSDDVLCRVLSSADVAIDPLPKNAWSDKSTMNKILEYMFFGIPIVAFDLTEARVSAQEAAIFVEVDDPRAMARAIAVLLDDPTRRNAMSEFGKERLRTAVAFEYSEPHLLAAYEAAWALHARQHTGRSGAAPVQAPR